MPWFLRLSHLVPDRHLLPEKGEQQHDPIHLIFDPRIKSWLKRLPGFLLIFGKLNWEEILRYPSILLFLFPHC